MGDLKLVCLFLFLVAGVWCTEDEEEPAPNEPEMSAEDATFLKEIFAKIEKAFNTDAEALAKLFPDTDIPSIATHGLTLPQKYYIRNYSERDKAEPTGSVEDRFTDMKKLGYGRSKWEGTRIDFNGHSFGNVTFFWRNGSLAKCEAILWPIYIYKSWPIDLISVNCPTV